MGKLGQYLSNKTLSLLFHAHMKVLYYPALQQKKIHNQDQRHGYNVCKKDKKYYDTFMFNTEI